jgi:hypothetical protein
VVVHDQPGPTVADGGHVDPRDDAETVAALESIRSVAPSPGDRQPYCLRPDGDLNQMKGESSIVVAFFGQSL